MGCDDKEISVEDLINDAINSIALNNVDDKIDDSNVSDVLRSIRDVDSNLTGKALDSKLNDIIKKYNICELPATPIFSEQQLDEVPCEIPKTNELPKVPKKLVVNEKVKSRISDNEKSLDKALACAEHVDTVNSIIKSDLKKYNNLNILLQVLIEYKDNFEVFKPYYAERLAEAARLTGKFQPILLEIKRIESEIEADKQKLDDLDGYITVLENKVSSINILDGITLSEAVDLAQSLYDSISDLKDQKDIINSNIDDNEALLKTTEEYLKDTSDATSIINNDFLNDLDVDDLSPVSTANLRAVLEITYELNRIGYTGLKNSLKEYSSALNVDRVNVTTAAKILQNPILKFKLEFPSINYIGMDEDVYNEDTGARSIRKIQFPIRGNSFYSNVPQYRSIKQFKKSNQQDLNTAYFNDFPNLDISNVNPSNWNPTGTLYTKYYNKFDDPVNNFFSLSERGLSDNSNQVDPSLVDSGSTKKIEGSYTYYVRDRIKMETFYTNFEKNLEIRKDKIRDQFIKPSKAQTAVPLKKLAVVEIKLLLSLAGVNVNIINESSKLNGVIESINIENANYINSLTSLTNHIISIKALMKKLKPTEENVKAKLVKLDPMCFDNKLNENSSEELKSKVKDATGSDPFGAKSLKEIDPTLPTSSDYRYWLEFSKTLNLVNLLPFPDKIPFQLRYWPVGLFFVTPLLVIKIPLPIIWIPLVSIPTPFGTFVIFLTINGLFISPVVFYISSSGYKQHILTVRGPSDKFGFDKDRVLIKPTIAMPLDLKAVKDSITNNAQNPLDKLNIAEKEKYELDLKQLEHKLSKIKKGTSSYKKVSAKLENLKASVKVESEAQKASKAINTKESAESTIELVKSSFKFRMEELGEPEFKECRKIQEDIRIKRENINKEIDETHLSDLNIADKRKKLKSLRKDRAAELVSNASKKSAIKKDTLDYYNKIKFPTISIPSDTGMLNPAVNSIDISERDTDFQLSDLKNDPTAEKNKIVRDSIKREITDVVNLVSLDDIPTNESGKIDIKNNIDIIKGKLLDINKKIINKLKGKNTEDIDQLNSKQEELQESLLNSGSDIEETIKLKKELNIIQLNIKNYNDTSLIAETNAVTPDVLDKLSSSDFKFNAFKSLTDLLPKPIVVDLPLPDTVTPVSQADAILKLYINNLTPDSLISLMGGATEVTPATIKEIFFTISNSEVPDNLKIENKIEASSIFDSSSGLLSALSIPFQDIPVYKANSLPKPIKLNLNMLKPILKKALESDADGFINCLPTNIDTNFTDLNPDDIKSLLTITSFDKLDDITKVLTPIFSIMNILKSGNGTYLDPIEGAQHKIKPFGIPIQAKFNAIAALKKSAPKSSAITVIDNESLEKAMSLINISVAPVMDIPASFIIPSAAASLGLSEVQRLFHPVLNADDIPPWERLSSKNFLHVLFIDEFIYEASNKLGFFRKYL